MRRILLAMAIIAGLAAPAAADEPADTRPNIIFILTDDMNATDMRWMPKTQALLGGEGTTWANSYVSLSLCCPARAAILSGQHAHNNGVWSNNNTTGGYRRLVHEHTYPVWLQEAGYRTVHLGKYLHGTGMNRPPGWSDWRNLVGAHSVMYAWWYNDNGVKRQIPPGEAGYQTDVLADWGAQVIGQEDGPFFMQIAVSAPHVRGTSTPPLPPLRYRNTVTERLPRPPNFNVPALLSASQISYLETLYKRRAESLMAVDDLVETIYQALKAAGKLDNTVIMFTSDNGYLMGEHGRISKVAEFEESMRVPLLARGPGFAHEVRSELVQNVDYPATWLELAGATPTHPIDGLSLLHPSPDRAMLMESSRPDLTTSAWWQGVIVGDWRYVEYASGKLRHLWNVADDPFELHDLAKDPAVEPFRRDVLAPLLAGLKGCDGAACVVDAPGV